MSNYFEDLVVDDPVELGSAAFSAEDIIAFARQFDPQRFHLDEEEGKRSLFGGLSASGWHTAAVWLRLMIDYRKRVADQIAFRGERPARYGPSPGFEKLKWLKPVLAGDTIRFTTRITQKIDSRSRPTIGLVVNESQGFNLKGERVFSLTSKIFVERRTPFQQD